MNYCDLTLPSPEENLACDEVLLDIGEAGLLDNALRVWESSHHFVVLGYANKLATEVNRSFCALNSIPILRRCTGGGTVLQGPGCLNYSLILSLDSAASLHSISTTNEFILSRHQAALAALLKAPVERQGQTDLAIGGLKFSGNAQRRRNRCLLFHGSFLLHMDFKLVEDALPMPSRQPEYRLGRSHTEFLTNLNVPAQSVKSALLKAWNANEPLPQIPFQQISLLARQKYALEDWSFKF